MRASRVQPFVRSVCSKSLETGTSCSQSYATPSLLSLIRILLHVTSFAPPPLLTQVARHRPRRPEALPRLRIPRMRPQTIHRNRELEQEPDFSCHREGAQFIFGVDFALRPRELRLPIMMRKRFAGANECIVTGRSTPRVVSAGYVGRVFVVPLGGPIHCGGSTLLGDPCLVPIVVHVNRVC
jgi:hypothetical protein